MIEKWQVRDSASSSFYMICLLSVDSVNAHLMVDSVLALHCIWVNHNVADDSVDGSYHFGLQNSNGLLAQVQHWRDVIRWLGQSIAPPPTLHPPIFSERTGSNLCFVRWVPNILTSANHLGFFKEAVGRNLPRAAGQPELDKLEISKSP
jgi:hypothetical protein